MLNPARIIRRLRSLATGRQRTAQIDDELRFHIEMEIAKHVRHGMTAAAARAKALRDFGSVARYRDETRDAHGVRPVQDFAQDVRVGLRSLLHQRAFAAVSILTLAIGIGGTTAVFGAVYGILLAPFPYPHGDRLVTLWQTSLKTGNTRDDVSPANFIDWRERSRSFEQIAAAEPWSLDYIGPDGPERFAAAAVTPGFFEALGTNPMLGRTFARDDSIAGRSVVVLSEQLWRSRFHADTTIVGRALVLDSIPTTVIGVMPRAFTFPLYEQAWIPKLFRGDERLARSSAYYTVVGRLRDGVTLDAARREMTGVAAALGREYPATNAASGVALIPVAESLVGSARRSLLILLGAVGFVLLIACANVASLQLAQAVRRRRELAVRAAIGAGRARLLRQLFAEALVVALLGGAAGVAVAHWGIAAIRALAPADLPRIAGLRTSPAVLAFALGISVLTALLFGLVPAIGAGRMRLSDALGSGGRTSTATRSGRRAHHALVIGEIALALVLLVGAGLLMRSFRSLLNVDRGFRTDRVLVVTLQAWSYYPTPAARIGFVRDATARLAQIPGVRSVGMTSSLPLSAPIGQARASVAVEGEAVSSPNERPSVHVAAVAGAYFETLAIPLRQGRLLGPADREGGALVAVVNEAFARRFRDRGGAIGQRITFGFQAAPATREIVGVVGDVRHDGLANEPRPSIFIPHAQAPGGAIHLVARTDGRPESVAGLVRHELAMLNGTMPLSEVTTIETLLDSSLRERRFNLSLLGAFSLTALLLAVIGIYGLMSQAIHERTHEIGIRLAVGARASDVLLMVVRQGATMACAGIGIGLVGALALTRLLRGMLFQVTPVDAPTYVSALVLLLSAALLACWVPARRAAALDPIRALHH